MNLQIEPLHQAGIILFLRKTPEPLFQSGEDVFRHRRSGAEEEAPPLSFNPVHPNAALPSYFPGRGLLRRPRSPPPLFLRLGDQAGALFPPAAEDLLPLRLGVSDQMLNQGFMAHPALTSK